MHEVMTPQPITIHPHEPLPIAKRLMERHRIRHLPVVDAGEILGFLSDRQLAEAGHHRYPDTLRVADLMQEHPYSLTPNCRAADALRAMATFKFEAIAIVSGRRHLKGIFTRHDALNLMSERAARAA
jgi:acetoin utilization protein AcuB